MIKSIEKTTNMVAMSTIGDVSVVQLRATIAEDGTANITKNIKNVETYTANKEECDTDYAEFEAKVLEAAQA